jgi:hypothetical protein
MTWTAKDIAEFNMLVDDCLLKPLRDHQERAVFYEPMEYQCDSCGEFVPAKELSELIWEDKLLLFCQAPKCQKRREFFST